MKPEELEEILRRQSWRPAPPEWRREILAAAAKLDPPPGRAANRPWAALTAWLSSIRLAGAGTAFAGLWILLLVCNLSLSVQRRGPAPAPPVFASNRPLLPTVWNLQLAELPNASPVPRPHVPLDPPLIPAKPAPRPRGDRPKSWETGRLFRGGVDDMIA